MSIAPCNSSRVFTSVSAAVSTATTCVVTYVVTYVVDMPGTKLALNVTIRNPSRSSNIGSAAPCSLNIETTLSPVHGYVGVKLRPGYSRIDQFDAIQMGRPLGVQPDTNEVCQSQSAKEPALDALMPYESSA